MARPPQGRQGSSQSQQSRVCRRAGCSTVVPTGCCVQYCEAHCTTLRCRIHGESPSHQERSCRHSGCGSTVCPQCSSDCCESHCKFEVSHPPEPGSVCHGCLAGCCAAHCNHRQCSHITGNPRARVRPVQVTNICRYRSCTLNAAAAVVLSIAPVRNQSGWERHPGEGRNRHPLYRVLHHWYVEHPPIVAARPVHS